MTPYELATFGLSVIPCHYGTRTERDKTPLLPWKEYQRRRAEREEISEWIERWGETNWAIVTGIVSGVIVLDIDSEEGEELVRNLGVPETPTVRTAKGRHLYFRHPGFAVRNFAKKLPGIDFRGDGGYVLAAGSVHPSGVIYEWDLSIEDVELADAPDWLLELIRAPEPVTAPPMPRREADTSRYVSAALVKELQVLANAPDGARNVTLNTVAFKLGTLVGARALERTEVEAALLDVAGQIGLLDSEAGKTRDTIIRGISDGQRHPRDLSRVRPSITVQPKYPWEGNGSSSGGNGSSSSSGDAVEHDAGAGTTAAAQALDGEEVYSPTWGNEPAPTQPVLTLNGNRIGSKGNLTVIVAAPGHGKSAVCEAICSKHLNDAADSFGIELEAAGAVAYIDTERSKEDHWQSWFRMTRRAKYPHGKAVPDTLLFSLYAMVPTIERRRELLHAMITDEPLGLLVLDGIGDFVLDVNDADECNTFLAWLMATAKQREFAVLTTIHHNPQPGNEKARGHLGSEVMRRAESVLILKRDLATGQRTLTTNFEFGKVRSGSDLCETYFGWNDEASMFVTVENGANGDGSKQQMLDAATEVFDGRISFSYTELATELKNARGIGIATAKRWIARLKSLNLLIKGDDGRLLLNRNEIGY